MTSIQCGEDIPYGGGRGDYRWGLQEKAPQGDIDSGVQKRLGVETLLAVLHLADYTQNCGNLTFTSTPYSIGFMLLYSVFHHN